MKISQLLSLDTIKLDLAASNKNEVIDQLVDVLWDAGKLTDKNLFKERKFIFYWYWRKNSNSSC